MTRAVFEVAYERTNRYEGGKVLTNLRTDRGGETYAGISRVHWPKWGGWPIIDRTFKVNKPLAGVDGRNLDDLHRSFFHDQFWAASGCDRLPDQDLANEVYDSAVNCGVTRSVEWLQMALNVCNLRGARWPDIRVTGITTQETVEAANTACIDPRRRWLLVQVIETWQRMHYVNLANRDPTQEENLLGWFRLRVQHATPCP